MTNQPAGRDVEDDRELSHQRRGAASLLDLSLQIPRCLSRAHLSYLGTPQTVTSRQQPCTSHHYRAGTVGSGPIVNSRTEASPTPIGDPPNRNGQTMRDLPAASRIPLAGKDDRKGGDVRP